MNKNQVFLFFTLGFALLFLLQIIQSGEPSTNLRSSSKVRRASVYWTDTCKNRCIGAGGMLCGRISRSCCHKNSCMWGFCRTEIKLAWCL